MSKQLVIINNERVFSDKNLFYCDNIDMKSIPEGLNENFEVKLILRKSKIKGSHLINLNKIVLSSNIFSFFINIFKTFKTKKTNYLLISITPYTFLAYIFLLIFRKKIFIYLRSNGHEEYRAILGFIGPIIYHLMYIFVTFKSNIIVCEKKLIGNKKNDLVYPSQLDPNWFKDYKKPLLDKPRLLYVGRIKVEKGIFSLIKIIEEMVENLELSVVGKPENSKLKNKKINYLGYQNNAHALRQIYDEHNIFILPSFTESHPQALDESLARGRPVILFEEISHVVKNKQGVFISKRNSASLSKTIDYIMSNYSNIQNSMKKNNLPTRKNFISQMSNILSRN